MNKTRLSLVCGLSLLGGLGLASGIYPDSPPAGAVETIRESDIRSTLYFLASDALQGREVNTPFNRIASEYLAHRFELLGLDAVTADGYFQYFTLNQSELTTANHLEILRAGSVETVAKLRTDFVPSLSSASGGITAPLLFAGYGITAPRHGYDDYRGVNPGGRIVVILEGEPGRQDPESLFDGLSDSEHSEEIRKILNAQGHGASGLVIVKDVPPGGMGSGLGRHAQFLWPPEVSQAPYSLDALDQQVRIPVVIVSHELGERLLEGSGADLARIRRNLDQKSGQRSFPLPDLALRLTTGIERSPTRVRNVLASLPGADPELRNEVVVISAHFDHVGFHNGEIFPGADDDASGTTGLLEIAEAFALSSQRPRRTMLFAAWNAEEKGLLGSRYYVEQPAWTLRNTTAVFQMDMIGRNEEIPDSENPRFLGLKEQRAEENTNSLHLLGYSRSRDLRDLVTRKNRITGLDLKFQYDSSPSNLLRRSDNWPFLVAGVPALFFHTGLHPDYHRPSDTPEKINYPKMERVVRLVFLSSWAVANSLTPPQLDSR